MSSSLPDDSTSFFEIDNDKDEIFITLKIEEYDQYIYIYIYFKQDSSQNIMLSGVHFVSCTLDGHH